MIYLRLAGGLGNQLYQIAAAILLANKHGVSVGVLVGSLGDYSVKRNPDFLNVVVPRNKIIVIDQQIASMCRFALRRFRFGRWFPLIGTNDSNFESRINSSYRIPFQLMDGYFQTQWSLSRFESVLENFKATETSNMLESRANSVVVHVRGSDYKSSPLHLVDHRYYTNAVNMARRSGLKRFVIISDDQEYSNEIFKKVLRAVPDIKYRILGGARTTFEDFVLIRDAKLRIIGNSTFAWWATALGTRSTPTWSPMQFLPNTERALLLPNEICVSNI